MEMAPHPDDFNAAQNSDELYMRVPGEVGGTTLEEDEEEGEEFGYEAEQCPDMHTTSIKASLAWPPPPLAPPSVPGASKFLKDRASVGYIDHQHRFDNNQVPQGRSFAARFRI